MVLEMHGEPNRDPISLFHSSAGTKQRTEHPEQYRAGGAASALERNRADKGDLILGRQSLPSPNTFAQRPSTSVKGSTEGDVVKNNTASRAGKCQGLSALGKKVDIDSVGL